MHTSPHVFLRQFIGVVVATLIPVILVAFVSLPMSLGGYPGEPRDSSAAAARHMT